MASKNPILRPATRADVIAMEGKLYGASFRGIAAEIDGKVIGVAGVMQTQNLQLFGSLTREVRHYPKMLITAARMLIEILNQYDSPIYAMPDEGVKNSARFLEYMGFKHYHGRIYRWLQQSPI
jgi:hypothetical protein